MWLKCLIALISTLHGVRAMSQSFVNSSSPVRPTFVVNFDIASVICQTTANIDDLKIFPISVLCDGKKDCFENPAMDDETFPYCSQKCVNKCGPHGVCLMDGGRSLCYCNDGFSGKKCEVSDINECAKKPCHWLARCTNTFGSYYCTCLPGFEGDGQNCTDIDECSNPSIARHCPDNAKCCNIPGSYFCNCTDGFAPKGSPLTACVDIDECAEGVAHCEGNTTCVNTIGSFQCVSQNCQTGFQELNGECVDIDECKQLAPVCDQRADCVNTNGSYHCICSIGFTGNGKTCTPLADCSLQPSICHKHAFCINELKMCLCQSGFIGDGINCYDMNECSTDPPVCKANEKCSNLEGSFLCCLAEQNLEECKKAKGLTCKVACANNAECRRGDCVCKDGFTGDPNVGCLDRNECTLNSTICPSGHWCVNLDGSYMCCSNDAPLSMCRGLLVGIAPELNEIQPNVSTINANISSVFPMSTERPTPSLFNLSSISNELENFTSTAASVVVNAIISSTEHGGIATSAIFPTPHGSIVLNATFSTPFENLVSNATISAPLENAFSNATHSTPLENIFFNSTFSTPVGNIIPNAILSTPIGNVVSNATHSTPLENIFFNATHSTPLESIFFNATFPTPVGSIIPNETHSTPFEHIISNATHSTPLESIFSNATHSTPLESIFNATFSTPIGIIIPNATHSTPFGNIISNATHTTPLESIFSNATLSTPLESISNATFSTPIGIIISNATHSPFESIVSNATHSTPFGSTIINVTHSMPVGSIVSNTTHSTPLEGIASNTTISTPLENVTSNLTHLTPHGRSASFSTTLGNAAHFTSLTTSATFSTIAPPTNATLSGIHANSLSSSNRTLLTTQIIKVTFNKSSEFTSAILPTTKIAELPAVGFTVNKNTTAIPCSEERILFCRARNMSCSIINSESRCIGCALGFVENEHGICIEGLYPILVTCDRATDCDQNAKCIDINPAGHLCVCKIGFIGDGKRCDDVDECYTPNVCSPNAHCINNIGSYNCVCNEGFVGDGGFCSELAVNASEGCLKNPSLCHEFATCEKNNICQCKTGFDGNGTYCTRIVLNTTDCVINPTMCDPNAECIERHCQCRLGYLGDGILCRPDPEDCHLNLTLCGSEARCVARRCRCQEGQLCKFANCETHPELCHVDAICVDKLCKCNNGFEGNGAFCKPSLKLQITPRAGATDKPLSSTIKPDLLPLTTSDSGIDNCNNFPSVCHRNAKCIHNQCMCDEGYVGNGRSCIPDPNDCLAYPSICHPNATCVAKMRCQCKPLFTGDGTTTCDPISKEDNCALTPHICHEHASCRNFKCECNTGYEGDGKKCSISSSNCFITPSMCHIKASCIDSRCVCNKGYIGDGTFCSVNVDDCTFGGAVCDLHAHCLDGKCKCNSGYTGSGIVCTRLDETSSHGCRFNATMCDSLADCIEGKCICKPGFSGTGLICKKDVDNDCSINPSLCDPNAFCLQKQCHCNANFVGNGTVCTDVSKMGISSSLLNASSSTATSISARTNNYSISAIPSSSTESYRSSAFQSSSTIVDEALLRTTSNIKEHFSSILFTTNASSIESSTSSVTDTFQSSKCSEISASKCHKNAECFRDGSKEECRCHAGFSGDGKTCEDINECSLLLVQCYKTATCVNTMGSYMCLCPPNHKGDGVHSCSEITKDEEAIDVDCERDGLTLLMNNKNNFNGKIFVKNQSQNSRCSKNYTSEDGPLYKFTALFAYCDVRMEAHNTFSTVIVVQKHPLFVTDGDEAYNLRCTYPAGEVMLMSHFNVSMLSTIDTLQRNGPTPQCSLSVLSSIGNESVAEAIVGQQLQLRLTVEPQATYGIVAKNCVAVNMENGETYKLTDSEGCAIDASIFPEWSQFNKSQLYANFLTFKWPDTAQIRFQCDCSPCFDQCEPVKCKNSAKQGWGKKKRDASADVLPTAIATTTSSQVYSNVVQVRDYDKFLAGESDEVANELQTADVDPKFVYSSESEELCVNSGIFAAALGLAASFAAVITVAGVCGWQQRQSNDKVDKNLISVGYENRWFVKSSGPTTMKSRHHNAVHKRNRDTASSDHWSATSTFKS